LIRLYNTLTRKKEPFVPIKEGKIGIYACGPTVYDYFHIGNARVFIMFDVLRRYLAYRGYDVTFVQNYTDVDDKMINKAAKMGITVDELAEKFIRAYEEDATALGILPADHHPRASQHVPEIIELIQKLMNQKMAYEIKGDVYFNVEAFPGYGKLSHQDLEELMLGARVEIDERKKHPMDFALWKKEKPGEPSWDSPWGRGRPGWHIECSAMSMHYLEGMLDIHAGGQDLIFPHHENEIAQSEGATAQPFFRYWMHVGFLNIDQEKMSKSLGNILTVRQLRKTIDPLAIRYFMLSAQYRTPINFSDEYLEQASKALERLNSTVYNVKERLENVAEGSPDEEEGALLDLIESSRENFKKAMDDDFNTAEAIAVLFEFTRQVNIYLNRPQGQKKNILKPVQGFYREINDIFGIIKDRHRTDLQKDIEGLIAEREEARSHKDWATADAIREQLKEQGIILEDTPQGVRWKIAAKDSEETT